MITQALLLLGRLEPGTADGTVLAVPAGHRFHIYRMFVANTDVAVRTYRLHHLRPWMSEASSTANALFYDVRVSANTTEIVGDGIAPLITLDETEALHGLASSANKITISFYGVNEVMK